MNVEFGLDDGNSIAEDVIDSLVAVELVLGLAALIALAAAVVSTVGHIFGFSHHMSVTATLFGISAIFLVSAGAAVMASIEVQHFSRD